MLAVGFALNVRDLSFESTSLTICSLFAIFNGLIVILYPIWLLLRLRQGRALQADNQLLGHRSSVIKPSEKLLDQPLWI